MAAQMIAVDTNASFVKQESASAKYPHPLMAVVRDRTNNFKATAKPTLSNRFTYSSALAQDSHEESSKKTASLSYNRLGITAKILAFVVFYKWHPRHPVPLVDSIIHIGKSFY
jgi:hypothetical protein